jgi:sec-independent protein translocase protein TatA
VRSGGDQRFEWEQAAQMDLGWQELVIILVVVVIIFGAGKLPEIGGALGKGIREFRSAATAQERDGAEDTRDTPQSASSARSSTVIEEL